MMRKVVLKRQFVLCSCVFVFMLFLSLSSCSPSLRLSINDSEGISYSFTAAVDDSIVETVRSFSGTQEDVPLFSARQIQDSLETAGFSDVEATLPSYASVCVSGDVVLASAGSPRTEDVLPLLPGALTFTSVVADDGSVVKEVRLSMSRQTLGDVLDIIPPETAEYVDLLSAPVFTGEKMSASEYTELVAAVYGGVAAKALDSSRVSVEVTVPRRVRSAKVSAAGGKALVSSNSVVFSVPLAELLTQSQEIIFCIQF